AAILYVVIVLSALSTPFQSHSRKFASTSLKLLHSRCPDANTANTILAPPFVRRFRFSRCTSYWSSPYYLKTQF
ncbi:hypothetical protein C8R44DRAFT_759418, partial [Mycena epipterygia]